MSRSKFRIREFAVSAVVRDGCGTVVDCEGRVLARGIALNLLRPLDDGQKLVDEMKWMEAAHRMLRTLAGRRNRQRVESDPWKRKAANLAASFRRRSLEPARPRGRCRFEQYRTRTWDEAVRRLWHQGHNRFRYVSRSGWHRWSCTVSNNHNKKSGGRYAQATRRNRPADSESDHSTELSVRSDGSNSDS